MRDIDAALKSWDEVVREALQKLTPAERLEGVAPRERLEGLDRDTRPWRCPTRCSPC